MCRSNSSAFSMIEVAVAIAIIAILAGAVAPLALKALNQQREQKTRENLKIAYEALYGARDRRVSNMASDFGFVPPVPSANLGFMTTQTAAGIGRGYSNTGALFYWGWNGPYWTGSVIPAAGTNGLPADGWGRSIHLQAGPQLISYGANGQLGGGDDILFPSIVGNPNTTLTVNINRIPPPAPIPALDVTVTITDLNMNNTRSRPQTISYLATQSGSRGVQLLVNPGPVAIQVSTTPVSTAILDLLPGESKSLEFQIYN